MKKFLIIAILISVVLSTLSLVAFAAEKMQRATKNAALGWTEIPKSIASVTKETDNPFMGITVGLLKGIANAFARTTSGIVDTVTIPTRSSQDQPVIKETMIDSTAPAATTK